MAAHAKSDEKETKTQSPKNTDSGVATEKDVRVRVFEGHRSYVYRVAMPENGRFALTVSEDETLLQWDLEGVTNEGVVISLQRSALVGIAVTADGKRAAVCNSYSGITLFDLTKGREVRLWKAHEVETRQIGGIAFLGQGDQLVSTCGDNWIRRWSFDTEGQMGRAGKGFQLQNVAVSADGHCMVSAAADKGLVLWSDVASESPAFLPEMVASMAPVSVTGNGRFAWTGTASGQVACWDIEEHIRVAALEGHQGEVRAVAVTPNGRLLASGGRDKIVRIWAAETGQCLAVLSGHTGAVNHIAITPDCRRIASVSDDRTLRVWDIPDEILEKTATSKKRGYMNAKVVLVGDSGVGKSGLALRLWHDRWNATESTHGMEIKRLVLPGVDNDPDVVREIWLWDLAGQPDYRLTHQIFMDHTSLALLVFDPQDPQFFETVGYWRHALGKVARSEQIPGILVAARCDRVGLRIMAEEIQTWGRERNLYGPILTAAMIQQHGGVAELLALIERLLPWDKMDFRSTMENFPALKDAILKVRDVQDIARGEVVTPVELETRVREAAPALQFASEDLRAVTGLLAGEGVLHALPYGDLVVLQPSWLNSYAATLVKMAGEDMDHLGHVPLALIEAGKLPQDDGTSRLSQEDEQQLLPALVELFLKRALAWKQDTEKGPMLVFPSYVRLPRPHPPPRPGRSVLYRFTGPLEQIYCTLVVRLHYSGLFAETKLYRQAVDFRTATGKLAALTMLEQGECGELEIYFGVGLDGDVQAAFQRFVHDHLYHKAVGLERLRDYFCPKCGEKATDRRMIDLALANRRAKLICGYCDPDDKPGIILLHDVLEQQFANSAGEERADEAKRRADEGITTASMEGIMVGEVQTIVFSADQIYRSVAEPDEGIDGEIEFRNANQRATGLTYRVQLKSGDSHLRMLKDGTEKFDMKPHYEDLWRAKADTPPVLLIIRTRDERTRFINATEAIREARKVAPGEKVTQLVFDGADFNKDAVLRLRDGRLRGT